MASPKRTGGTRPRIRPTLPFPRAPRLSAGPWPRSHKIRMCRAGTDTACPVGSSIKVYGFTDLDRSQPDAWRYLTEVQDAGRPAEVTGYRYINVRTMQWM
jgi:hypothetical protein